tara:strand:- start:3650 stop:4657 length:1008 start_codon:yes stop_codon:yes gene_type:complete
MLNIKKMSNQELITQDNNDRYCLFPIKYPDIWEKYNNHKSAFWTCQEIDMSVDKKEWNTLSDNEKYFIENILAFFSNSDSIVVENLVTNFCSEITIPEIRCFYGFQTMMENIHAEAYGLMIDTFIDDPVRKNDLFHGMDSIPCVKEKTDWALKWIEYNKDNDSSLATRLFAFGIVEGLFFSGSFCAIFWLKENQKLVNSLGKSNEWISRDESLHTDFAILLYTKYIQNKLPEKTAHDIMREAVQIEEKFICESIPVSMIGMSSDLMKQYIHHIADRLLVQFGYSKIFYETNPFTFMNKISLDGKTNFFEQRVSEYNLVNKHEEEQIFQFDLSEEF